MNTFPRRQQTKHVSKKARNKVKLIREKQNECNELSRPSRIIILRRNLSVVTEDLQTYILAVEHSDTLVTS